MIIQLDSSKLGVKPLCSKFWALFLWAISIICLLCSQTLQYLDIILKIMLNACSWYNIQLIYTTNLLFNYTINWHFQQNFAAFCHMSCRYFDRFLLQGVDRNRHQAWFCIWHRASYVRDIGKLILKDRFFALRTLIMAILHAM